MIPQNPHEKLWHMLVTPALRRQKQVHAQDLLANQFNLIGKPQVPARDPDSKIEVDRSLGMTFEVVLWPSHAWVCTLLYTLGHR